jgi:hypothetical protein
MLVQKIKDIQIRDDGNQVKMTFEGMGNITLQMSFELMQEFISKAFKALSASRVNRTLKSDTPKEFSPMPEVILAENLELVLHEDSSLEFLIVSQDGRSIQVALHDEHGKVLRQILSGNDSDYRLS